MKFRIYTISLIALVVLGIEALAALRCPVAFKGQLVLLVSFGLACIVIMASCIAYATCHFAVAKLMKLKPIRGAVPFTGLALGIGLALYLVAGTGCSSLDRAVFSDTVTTNSTTGTIVHDAQIKPALNTALDVGSSLPIPYAALACTGVLALLKWRQASVNGNAATALATAITTFKSNPAATDSAIAILNTALETAADKTNSLTHPSIAPHI